MKSGRQMLEKQARTASELYLIDHIRAVQLEQYREEREAVRRGKKK